MVGIYKITNLKNGKIYIGQSIDVKRRFWDHRCASHEGNRHLQFALKKYGKESFKYEILEECAAADLDERERYWIKKLKPEYNVSPGGQGRGRRHTDETKEIIRQKARLFWEGLSGEKKAAIIQNNLTGPKTGHAVSDQTRQKIREANIGKRQTPETIEKRKAAIKVKKLSGYVQSNAGHRKKVICIETGEAFESVKAAALKIGVDPSNITNVLKGKQRSTKGFHFKYLEV